MALTLADFRDVLSFRLGNRTDVADSDLDRWLNHAQLRIARVHDFEEMKRSSSDSITPTGTPSTDKNITITDNMREIFALVRLDSDGEAFKLIGVSPRQWDQLMPNPADFSTGEPTHYTVRTMNSTSTTIEVWRVPDTAFTLLYYWTAWPTDLTVTTQESDFLEKDDIILAFATSNAYHDLGMREDGNSWFAQARAMLQDAVAEDRRKPDIFHVARGYTERGQATLDYWRDPFIRRNA